MLGSKFIHVSKRTPIRRITAMSSRMGTFSVVLDLLMGNSPITVKFPHKGQTRRAFMFSLIFAWTNGWVNNRDACHLSRHRAHYGVTNVLSQAYIKEIIKSTHYWPFVRKTQRVINAEIVPSTVMSTCLILLLTNKIIIAFRPWQNYLYFADDSSK